MRFFVYLLLLDDKFEIEEPYTCLCSWSCIFNKFRADYIAVLGQNRRGEQVWLGVTFLLIPSWTKFLFKCAHHIEHFILGKLQSGQIFD